MGQRSNKFAGRCGTCGGEVPAQTGTLDREGSKWVVRHRDCNGAGNHQPQRSDMVPTAEQAAAVELFDRGESMVIQAGAGTGKTSTLKLLGERKPQLAGQYIAFNKAIVVEAGMKFPSNVACNTAHSLAYRAIGHQFKDRLKAPRQTNDQIARMLGVGKLDVTVGGVEHRTLAAGFLAGRVMQAVTRFCQSADEQPNRRHFPYIDGIDLPDAAGNRTFDNNNAVAEAMMPFVNRAWADLNSTTGALRFGHDHYLKIWQLSDPKIAADFILFDEAQDANPVMAAIVAAQDAQVVYVGDSQQAIYEFTGAVNALENIDSDHRVFLTQSFRFGTAVADVANKVLARLEAELRLVGTETIPSTVGIVEQEAADAVLCRTNAHAVETVLAYQQIGRRPYLVGGGDEVVRFAKAADDLMEKGHTDHAELGCFNSWGAVEQYVASGDGDDLKLMVTLVNRFGVETILAALDNMPTEEKADVIVSTAHKAKGREWNAVKLGTDFPVDENKVGPSELRLLYVAITRAKLTLDMTSVDALFSPPADDIDGDVDEGVNQ